MWEFYPQSVNGIPVENLRFDQAFLSINSSLTKNVWLYQLSDECDACPFKKLRKIPARSNVLQRVETDTQLKWSVYSSNVGPYAYDNSTPICTVDANNLGQYGVYNLTINENNCTFGTFLQPVNPNFSILWLLLIILGLCAVLKAIQVVYKRYFVSTLDVSNEPSTSSANPLTTNEEPPPKTPTSNRLCSLDAFRGLAIVAMIFANSGCGKYHWFEHAAWNGIHAADFIFPSFLWIMGVCMPISLNSQISKNVPSQTIAKNILIRSLKLFFIGMLIHTAHGPAVSDIRIMGVLQRFGIAYLFVGIVQVLFHKTIPVATENERQSPIIDILLLLPQWVIMIAIAITQLHIIFFLPVPDCGSGYLGPGGIHEMGRFNNCIGGATGYIDRLIISESHLYQHPRAAAVYDESQPFDPEGPFGCLLTIVQVFFGVQCGQILLVYKNPAARLKRWAIWSIATFLLGGGLCKFSINDGFIPINKNLWSLSYVLVTTAFAYCLLALFYIVIDIKKWWSGKPLLYAGMNAIIMYIGSELLGRMYPFYWHIDGMKTHFMFLLSNIWTAAMWNLVAYYLYLRKIFFAL